MPGEPSSGNHPDPGIYFVLFSGMAFLEKILPKPGDF